MMQLRYHSHMTAASERQYAIFLERAKAVHGDRYNYGDLTDRDAKGRVKIICPDHGDFWQYRSNHLSGSGCKPCALSSRTTTVAEFIERSQAAHGAEVYDYSQVEQFRTTRDKVTIICSTHGEFSQIARDHMRGVGCAQCAIDSSRKSFAEFVAQARRTHGDTYEYVESSWRVERGWIAIVCHRHGEFLQRQWNHIVGDGCPPCGLERRTWGFSGFLERASSVHGDTYSYIEESYLNSGERISIICSEHGGFQQFVGNHLNGQGCPRCFGTTSQAEKRFGELLAVQLPEVTFEYSCRSVISPYELDIYIPELRLAIEFNGVYWHSKEDWARDIVEGSRLSREALKSQRCEDAGIQLLHVWEDDWTRDPENWSNMILEICRSETPEVDGLHRIAAGNLEEAIEVYSRRLT